MRNATRTAAALLFLLLCVTSGHADGTNWGYTGQGAPEHWSRLDPSFSMCCAGRNQSPVNLGAMIDGDLPALDVAYTTSAMELANNGRTIEAECAPGSVIRVAGRSYELRQFHFHAPSEHTIDGRSFPLEAHFVHADKEGNLAVVAVLFREGAENAMLARLWAAMPKESGAKHELDPPAHPAGIMPAGRDYYRYSGSLTTPPCSEGVSWFVLAEHPEVSSTQVEQFTRTLGFANNRPVQPVNARVVVK